MSDVAAASVDPFAPKRKWGGPQPNSGRPKSALTHRTRRLAEEAVSRGMTPLQVMLEAMYAYHLQGKLPEAVDVATKAAPYIHPRLASVQHVASAAPGLDNFSLEELTQLRRAIQAVENEAVLELTATRIEEESDPFDAL
jgi:hypothetical protein